MSRFPLSAFAAFSLLAFTATAQTFDTSGNSKLNGPYFVREVLIAGQNVNGTIKQANSVAGTVTFDGKGGYSFTGTVIASNGASSTVTRSGVYYLAANGLFGMDSLADPTDVCYGTVSGLGPSAIIGSATESGSSDLLVAIPAGSGVTNGSLRGSYTGGYIDFTGANIATIRQARFALNADGAGNFGTVAATGNAANLVSGTQLTQSVAGVTYSVSGGGSGTVSFGASSPTQLVSGAKNLYVSADGNILLAGSAGGFDIMVAVKSLTGTATNATSSGLYFTGALEYTVDPSSGPAVDAFYGSTNSTGTGTTITHNRFSPASFQSYDLTYDVEANVQANGTQESAFYSFTYGAAGKAFIATGKQGLYSLHIGFAAPTFTGTGVFINPTGVVNAATFAPITNPIAPNEVVTLFGSGLAPSTVSATSLPLPTILGGVQVSVNGTPAPLFYVSAGQIAFLVPPTISPDFSVANATVQVTNNNVKSNAVTLYTWYTAPGIFSTGGSGIGAAAATHVDASLISQSKPAAVGETVVIYAGGLGSTTPAVPSGAPSPSSPPATVFEKDSDHLYIGSTEAAIQFEGLTPGLSGLYQINATVGSGTPVGNDYIDLATIRAYTSQTMAYITGSAGAKAAQARGPARPPRKLGTVDGPNLGPHDRINGTVTR